MALLLPMNTYRGHCDLITQHRARAGKSLARSCYRFLSPKPPASCVWPAASSQSGGAAGELQQLPWGGAGRGHQQSPPQAPREPAADADQCHPGDHEHRARVYQAPQGHLRGQYQSEVATSSDPVHLIRCSGKMLGRCRTGENMVLPDDAAMVFSVINGSLFTV